MNRLPLLALLVLSTSAIGAGSVSIRTTAPRIGASNATMPRATNGDGGISFMPQRLDFSVASGHRQTLPLSVQNGGAATVTYTFDPSTTSAVPSQSAAVSFAQNSSMANTNGGIACIDGNNMSSGSSWWRRFPLVEVPGVAQTLRIRAIELASGPDSVGTSQTELHVYTLPHSWPAGTIGTEALTEIGSTAFPINAGQALTVPINATVMGTSELDLVVEWRTPGNPATVLFPGSNYEPETHVSFVSSPACEINQPTPLYSFVWPAPSMVMKVHAQQASGQVAFNCQAPSWLVYERARRGTLTTGASAHMKVSVDTSSMEPGDYETGICVRSGPIGARTQSLSIVPVSVHVANPF